jgi:hypothetical protein
MPPPRPSRSSAELRGRRSSAFVAALAAFAAVTFAGAPPLRAAAPAPPPGYLGELIEQARAARLAETRDWQVLLHYRRTLLGGWLSEADGPGFFLAGPAGKRDRAAELEATLAAFFAPPLAPAALKDPDAQHPQCRFPARYAWLKRALAIDARRLPDQPCPFLDAWRTGMSAQAATLVYATAYLNNPASMYGHTFLRLSRATGEGNPLLDYAVNFGADVTTTSGLLYVVRGLSGGFPGRFFVVPYYVKVQEYSNIDSRDLWEYELGLTAEQVTRLVLHTWETRSTWFDYYFFSENCAYQLLTLLEVADPSLHLVDRFGLRVIPADTVRTVLEQAGLVRRIAARPSLVSMMTRRKERLDGRGVRAAEAWVKSSPGAPPPDAAGVAPAQQARVIDAAYDYLRYREGSDKEPSDDFKKRERRMLLARGQLGVPPQELAVRPGVDAPERGHATLRLGAGGGVTDNAGAFETLSLRFAIHDYLDPPGGYPDDAELEMVSLRLRYDNQPRRLGLDRLTLLQILSASPLDRWVRSASWRAWLGVDNARELGCTRASSDRAGWRCLYAGIILGGGLATRFGPSKRMLAFALAESDGGAGPAFAGGQYYRIGLGAEAGLATNVATAWRFELGGRYVYYVLGERHANARARVGQAVSLAHGLDLRVGVETAGTYAQATTELLGYF